MRVLFVVPNWHLHDEKFTTVSIKAPRVPPLEFCYILPQLNSDIHAQIYDGVAHRASWEQLTTEIKAFRPDIIVSSTAPSYLFWRCPPLEFSIPRRLGAIARVLRIPYLLVGPHASISPREVQQATRADFLIRGEAEVSLATFLNSHLLDMTVEGLFSHTRQIDNGIARVRDLAVLPEADYSQVNLQLYQPHLWSPTKAKSLEDAGTLGSIIEFSRGCPFDCPYCFRAGFRDEFRHRPVSTVAQEIRALRTRGVGYLFFIDELFNYRSEALSAILAVLKEERMSWGCQCRPDMMTEDLLEEMVQSGCIYVEYGVESTSAEVAEVLRKGVRQDRVVAIIRRSRELLGREAVGLGFINFHAPDIARCLGVQETLSAKKWVAKAIRPYPGSALGDHIRREHGVEDSAWGFALRFVWFLQLEYLWHYLFESHPRALKLVRIMKILILKLPLWASGILARYLLSALYPTYRKHRRAQPK